jgi:hypothetical protein
MRPTAGYWGSEIRKNYGDRRGMIRSYPQTILGKDTGLPRLWTAFAAGILEGGTCSLHPPGPAFQQRWALVERNAACLQCYGLPGRFCPSAPTRGERRVCWPPSYPPPCLRGRLTASSLRGGYAVARASAPVRGAGPQRAERREERGKPGHNSGVWQPSCCW